MVNLYLIDMVAATTFMLEGIQKKLFQDTKRLMNDWQKQF